MNKNGCLGIIATIAVLVTPSISASATSPFHKLIDFNGDSKTDVSWYNYNTGDTSAWLINGSSATYPPVYATVSPSSGWRIQGFGDFNGDGKTDLFWYNYKTGDTSAWLINGGSVISYISYRNVPTDSGWGIQGFGDANGDGKTDLFWYNSNTGDTSVWLINGSNATYPPVYTRVPPSSGWRIQGVGDANGDGKTDLFWYNSNTGDTSVWLINGSSATYPPVYTRVPPSSGWRIQGVGDANGDGKTDLFWYNYNTGDTSVWLINGSNATYPPVYTRVPPSSGWRIQGVGDANGDGKTDLFWYNYNTGDTSVWLINGSSATYPPVYATVSPSSGWRIQGFGDFNGDGKTDLFWYNYKTGDTSAWLINGGSVISYISYRNVPTDSGWFALFASQATGKALHRLIIE